MGHRIDSAAAQQSRREAEQRPLPHAGRAAFQALHGGGHYSMAQHDVFMATGVSGKGLS